MNVFLTFLKDPDSPASLSPAQSPLSMSPAGSPAPTARPQRPRPRPGPPVMTASGPFARGNDASGPRGGARMQTAGGGGGARRGVLAGLSMGDSSRADYREPDRAVLKERENYSDQEDDGFEIVDLDEVNELDELAPRALPRMKQGASAKKRSSSKEGSQAPAAREEGEKDKASQQADALDLSESEDEEVMDDLLEDFVPENSFGDVGPENQLYLFQFPPMFPNFSRPPMQDQVVEEDPPSKTKQRRSVAFADDTVGGGGAAGRSPRDSPAVKEEGTSTSSSSGPPEGQIGRLDVFRDGRVHFRFGNDLIMEVMGGSQTSFLQHTMVLDEKEGTATTLGEVRRKFVVAPEISSMLADAQLHDEQTTSQQQNSMQGLL